MTTQVQRRDGARVRGYGAILLTLTIVAPAAAQIVVSSNDNKAVWVNGINTVPANPKPDTVTIIDLNGQTPRVIAELDVPGGWSAPPQSVAITPDESLALVLSSARLDPADSRRTIFNNVMTVIDLKATPPAVVATLETGLRPAGVSINRSGTLALVGNRGEGTVSVFTIAGKTVTPAGKVTIGPPELGPSLPVFTPDGRRAFVSLNGGHRLAMLSIDGSRVEYTKQDVAVGLQPYSIEITPDGNTLIAANIGNGPTGGVDTLHVVDLRLNPPRVVGGVFTGIVPEGFAISPDGRFVAVALQNGAQLGGATPWSRPNGTLQVYRLDRTTLTPVAAADIGRWAQGVVWNREGTTILVQAAADNRIEVFGFDGQTLMRREPIQVGGSPTGIRTSAN